MSFPPLMPVMDRPLSADERCRVHVALLEVEQRVGMIRADVSDWYRVFSVQASAAISPGAYELHLFQPRSRLVPVVEDVPRRWWHRFTDWWYRW